jgi:hypothetical protein
MIWDIVIGIALWIGLLFLIRFERQRRLTLISKGHCEKCWRYIAKAHRTSPVIMCPYCWSETRTDPDAWIEGEEAYIELFGE